VTAQRTRRAGTRPGVGRGTLAVKDGHPAADARATGERVPTVQETSEHRADVVRRLLERGLSEPALRTLFPGWDELISQVVADHGRATEARRTADR
jgi:hypothetical protein